MLLNSLKQMFLILRRRRRKKKKTGVEGATNDITDHDHTILNDLILEHLEHEHLLPKGRVMSREPVILLIT